MSEVFFCFLSSRYANLKADRPDSGQPTMVPVAQGQIPNLHHPYSQHLGPKGKPKSKASQQEPHLTTLSNNRSDPSAHKLDALSALSVVLDALITLSLARVVVDEAAIAIFG